MSSAATTYSMILGDLMKKGWEDQGLTQQEFFQASGISTGNWSRLMRGQAHFQMEDIRNACRVLQTSVHELTAKADDLEKTLQEKEDVVVVSKDDLKKDDSKVPAIIAGAALGFLLAKALSGK